MGGRDRAEQQYEPNPSVDAGQSVKGRLCCIARRAGSCSEPVVVRAGGRVRTVAEAWTGVQTMGDLVIRKRASCGYGACVQLMDSESKGGSECRRLS